MPDSNPCADIKGLAREYCETDDGKTPFSREGSGGEGVVDSASETVKDLAKRLADTISGLVAPSRTSAPAEKTHEMYVQFHGFGQHLAVAIFVCVVVVCALTAWQGTPRLKQLGATTGWTLVAVAGMAAVPGAVLLLNAAASKAFTAAFNSNESTLFGAINESLEKGGDAGNPLGQLLIISALVVCLGFAALVYTVRTPGILVFVCIAPLVLASLARGGDTTAVRAWAARLLGLIFAPLALLLISPLIPLAGGSLVLHTVLLLAADALMLRMIFHGIPYFGPRVARAARSMVERRTPNAVAMGVVRAGVPQFYEQESAPRGPRTLPTPGRAARQDGGVLLAAYGINKQSSRPGRLTTASAVASARREETDRADRTAQISQARRQARAAAQRQNPPTP